MKSVYSAVRTGSLNKAVCASSFRTNSDLCHLQDKLIGFITEMKSVYSAVQTGSLNLVNINLLKPTGYVMHQQFNIQQLYALPTLYLCVLYLSQNK